MALPLRYNFRNVVVRWRTTVFTVLGVAAVVGVFVLLRALARGIESTSGNTGDPRNILVVRKGSQAESGSLVTREQYRTLQYFEEIARNAEGEAVVSAELVMIVSAPRRAGAGEANTLIRGVTPRGMELRPQVSLVEGRWFQPGRREVVVSRRLSNRFEGFELGGTLKAGRDRLTVVGIFDGQGSAFDSEAWMDADESRAIFDREQYSSLLLRPKDAAAAKAIMTRLEEDKRLALRAEPETEYYSKQTMTAMPFKILGGILGVAMSVGAVFAAMNTMYASVAARTREVGTLRVLGYSRGAIVLCFMIEGTLVAVMGGVLGCGLALLLNLYVQVRGVYFGTMDFQSFAETVFQFRVTPDLVGLGLLFSAVIGVVGSFLPALRAARLPVIAALKSV
ncbi:MAG: ABC transporter permease [Verrucomicrobia bacterium]|nr:ABC transporter permease [Verrucomicrobiota bacterium]